MASSKAASFGYLRSFWETNPEAEQPLKSWVDEVKKANWSQPADIKAQYRSASILKDRRVVFNIKGNDYRLVVSVAYRFQAVYVKLRAVGVFRQRARTRHTRRRPVRGAADAGRSL